MLKLLFIYFYEFVLVALLQSLALTCQTMSPVMSPRPVTCRRSVRSAPSASGRPSLNDRVENSGMPDCKCHGQIFVCKFCFQIKKKQLGGMWDIYKVFIMTEWQANYQSEAVWKSTMEGQFFCAPRSMLSRYFKAPDGWCGPYHVGWLDFPEHFPVPTLGLADVGAQVNIFLKTLSQWEFRHMNKSGASICMS